MESETKIYTLDKYNNKAFVDSWICCDRYIDPSDSNSDFYIETAQIFEICSITRDAKAKGKDGKPFILGYKSRNWWLKDCLQMQPQPNAELVKEFKNDSGDYFDKAFEWGMEQEKTGVALRLSKLVTLTLAFYGKYLPYLQPQQIHPTCATCKHLVIKENIPRCGGILGYIDRHKLLTLDPTKDYCSNHTPIN